MRLSNLVTVAALSAAGAFGCVAEIGTPDDLAESSQEVETVNAMTVNRISSNRISSNKLSWNRLSAGWVNYTYTYNYYGYYGYYGGIQLDVSQIPELANGPEGREYLRYVVECALPAGQWAYFADAYGTSYYVAGALGVAPQWAYGALDTVGQERLTACLMARTNFFGVSVPISIRNHDGLTATSAESSQFPYYEATFAGNMFLDPPVFVACKGSGLMRDEYYGAASSSYMDRRVCASTGNCGFQAAGSCMYEYEYNSYGYDPYFGDFGGYYTDISTTHACATGTWNQGADNCYEAAAYTVGSQTATPSRQWANPVSVYLRY